MTDTMPDQTVSRAPSRVMLRPGATVRVEGEELIAVAGGRGVRLQIGPSAAPLWSALEPLLVDGLDPTWGEGRSDQVAAGVGTVLGALADGGITIARPEGERWESAAEALRAWALRECSDPQASASRIRTARWTVYGPESLRTHATRAVNALGLPVHDGGALVATGIPGDVGGHPMLQVVADWNTSTGGDSHHEVRVTAHAVATSDALRYLVLDERQSDRVAPLADGLALHGATPSSGPVGARPEVLAAALVEQAMRRAAQLTTTPVIVGPGVNVRSLPDAAGQVRPIIGSRPDRPVLTRTHVDEEAALDRLQDVLVDADTGPLGAPRPGQLRQVPVPVVVGSDHLGQQVVGWGQTERVARRRVLFTTVSRWVADILGVEPYCVATGVDLVEATATMAAQRLSTGSAPATDLVLRHGRGGHQAAIVGATEAERDDGALEAEQAWQVLDEAGIVAAATPVVIETGPAALIEHLRQAAPSVLDAAESAQSVTGIGVIDAAELVVLLSRGSEPSRTPILRIEATSGIASALSASREAGDTCVPVAPLGPGLLIGPVDAPGRTGCANCAATRYRAVLRGPGSDPAMGEGRAVPMAGWDSVAESVARDLKDASLRDPGRRGGRAVMVLPSASSLADHRVIPLPGCDVCGSDQQPPDSPAPGGDVEHRAGDYPYDMDPGAELAQSAPGSLRQLPPPDVDALRETLVDHRFGPVAHSYRDLSTPLAFAVAELVVPGVHERVGGYGRASDHQEAERVALLEALERDAGTAWKARSAEAIRATAADLGDAAIDPRTLGLPEPDRVTHTAGIRPFDPHTAVDWIPALDLTDGSAPLVPAHAAYHGYPHRPDDPPLWLRDSSNGCALGSSLTEATLHGLVELIERDAFLLAWWGRRSGAGSPIPTDGLDPLTTHLIRVADQLGYDMRLLDITSDIGIPTVAAVAVAREPDADVRGAYHCAAGANPNLAKAAAAAVVEVATTLSLVASKQPEPEGRRTAMLADPFQVRTLEDHVALHEDPSVAPRWRTFLAGTEQGRAPKSAPFDASGDLRQVLDRVVRACVAVGARPLVVDITTEAVRAAGLRAAKVLAPGMVPMSFGHAVARTAGLPRLDALLPKDPQERDRYLDPHPFP